MGTDIVSVDSSKALKLVEEYKGYVSALVKHHEALEVAFATAYKNDGLVFYSKMGKMATQFKEGIQTVVKQLDKVSEQLLEHANRMAKFSEEY